jgi:hypothetical protein
MLISHYFSLIFNDKVIQHIMHGNASYIVESVGFTYKLHGVNTLGLGMYDITRCLGLITMLNNFEIPESKIDLLIAQG